MKYECNFCGTNLFSADDSQDGKKCPNCKKGRLVNPEIKEIDEFLAELDADLMEMEIDLGLEPGSLSGRDFTPSSLLLKDYSRDPAKETPYEKGRRLLEQNEGLTSGLKEISEEAAKSLKARIYGGITRKKGEYCRVCVYYKPFGQSGETGLHKAKGNCTIESWKIYSYFHWCEHFRRKEDVS